MNVIAKASAITTSALAVAAVGAALLLPAHSGTAAHSGPPEHPPGRQPFIMAAARRESRMASARRRASPEQPAGPRHRVAPPVFETELTLSSGGETVTVDYVPRG
jgi:hypothetical protein